MGAVHGWMDEGEVRRLAEGLMAAAPVPSDEGFGEDFVGFAEMASESEVELETGSAQTVVANLASGALARASERARAAGLLGPVAAAVEGRAGSVGERLEQFRAWLTSEFGATEAFLIDHEGQVIFDSLSPSKGGDFARNLARAACRAGREAAAGEVAAPVHLKLGHAAMLEVFSLETTQGSMVMAAVVPAAIAPAAIGRIAGELAKVLGAERRV